MFENLIDVTHVAKVIIKGSKNPMLIPFKDGDDYLLTWCYIKESWIDFKFKVKYSRVETITYDEYMKLTKDEIRKWVLDGIEK